ncbi:MAG: FGGY-family carbohydrate kinase [bacterium]
MTAPQDKYILAIDLGTSGPKVALVSATGSVAAYEFEQTQVILIDQGGAEQDPAQWWQAIKKACQRLLGSQAGKAAEIVAISCTSQWSGTVAVDRDGQPLMNAIIWMDSRGAPYVRQVTGGLLRISGYGLPKLLRWLRLTGGIPGHAGKDSIAHILYIKNKLPDLYERTYKFLEPKDYLNLRLTGKFAASTDSVTLHWLTDNRDISNIDYHDSLLAMAGVAREKLPALEKAVDILAPIKPEVAKELGLSEHVQVIVGTPDVQSAAIGSGAVRDYEGHLYLGTSSWLTCHVPYKKTDLFHNIASLPSAIPGRYFVANEQESAGACLNFLENNILFHKDELTPNGGVGNPYRLFDQIADRTPAGSGRVIFTPWLYGERTPVDDHLVRSGFYNQSLHTTRDHLIRAVFEGVAYNSNWLLKYVEKFIKRRFEAITIIGGGARSEVWCQIHADVLNRPVRQVVDPIQANLRGAAFLASVALGYLTFAQIPDQVEIVRTFQPNPANREIYDLLFREFLNIYKKNRGIYARLNKVS